jgi:deoxyribonuclease V
MVVTRLYRSYNRDVKVDRLHSWRVSPAQALDLQQRLAEQVSKKSEVAAPRFIAGVDISAGKASEMATAAVVVLNYPELKLVEMKVAQGRLDLPYIPGLLSFRESPLTLAACQELTINPDLLLVDGQGIAHPRRFGLASHLGLFLNTPTIGCAKSRLCGQHEEPGVEPGSYAEVKDKGETIGVALRTKLGVKPIYVSIGHKVDLQTAIHWVMKCCRGYRLPEPTRLAHLAAGGNLKPESTMASEVGYQGRLLG